MMSRQLLSALVSVLAMFIGLSLMWVNIKVRGRLSLLVSYAAMWFFLFLSMFFFAAFAWEVYLNERF